MVPSRFFGALVLLSSLFASTAWSQTITPPNTPTNTRSNAESPESAEMVREAQHMMQKNRQKKRAEDMKRDSQKLLELATELKSYVDKAGENVLSLDVIHKAEEMERLARQVKNNMRSE